MKENEEFSKDFAVKFLRNEITLYDALTFFMYQNAPLPGWVADAIEDGFADRVAGKRTLDQVFGLVPRPGKQIDKAARKLTYAPSVYWEVVRRNENGEPIDMEMFEKIAEDFAPTFKREWPNAKPPGAMTLKGWYLEELKNREPETAKKRNKLRT
jgi:hypothetical protein